MSSLSDFQAAVETVSEKKAYEKNACDPLRLETQAEYCVYRISHPT